MTRSQWGHGYHRGINDGQAFGELTGKGAEEIRISSHADHLYLIALALRVATNDRRERTDAWWSLLTMSASKEIEAIAQEIGSLTAATHQFRSDTQSDVQGQAR